MTETIPPSYLTEMYIEVMKWLNISVPPVIFVMAQAAKCYINDECEYLIHYADDDGKWSLPILDRLFTQCAKKLAYI